MDVKYIVIGIIILVICLVIFLIPKMFTSNSPKQLELIYKTNSGIPFRWKYEIEDESIVKLVDSSVIPNKDKRPTSGAPMNTKYIFKGLKEGETKITFKFVNITNNEVEKVEENLVKVDKDLNIYLVK